MDIRGRHVCEVRHAQRLRLGLELRRALPVPLRLPEPDRLRLGIHTKAADKADAEDRKATDKCADYLVKHAKFMRYDICLNKGYPIATGVIEGACRHLVKDRMDLTGARWGRERAEAVLQLRALRASGDFDAYWAFHESCEHHRNHQAHYRGPIPPVVVSPTFPNDTPYALR